MDLEGLSSDDFDAAAWLNAAFNNSDLWDNKEAFISSMSSKIQLYIQEVSSALENTSQQVLVGLPKLVKEAENLQTEAEKLRTEMSKVQKEISQVHEETGACMANLERLDEMKTKLEVAKQGLQESDGWGKLVTELEDLFERNDLGKICEKLSTLQKSLAAQEGLSGQNEREIQVEGFKNRLEALASPSVVQSFTVGDVEQSKKYVNIFSDMKRLPQLRQQYYRTVQKSALQQNWNAILDLSDNNNHFLYEYYEFLSENYLKQVRWCTQVFGSEGPNEALLALVELLPSLQPTRESVILAALKGSNDKLDVLDEFSSANIHFAFLLSKHFETIGYPEDRHIKFLSESIFDYFNTFISQYPAIEQNNLAGYLAALNVNKTTSSETIRLLGPSNRKVLELINSAMKRCDKITQNCAIAPLASVLISILKSFLEKYKKAQQQLTATRSIEQDWSLLQNCMSFLENIGDLHKSLLEIDSRFADNVLKAQKTFQKSIYLGYKLREKRDLNEFKKIHLKVKEHRERMSSESEAKKLAIFSGILDLIKPICVETHDTTLAAVFAPIEKHLATVEPPQTLNSSGADLPDYSFAPQEFITQVGQYLLTLPQHLEPVLLSPTASLKLALEICDSTKYQQNIPCADILLSLVVDECCAMYQNQILKIQSLDTMALAKQVATDIEYFGSVLEELGLSLNLHLQQTAVLLRAPQENYLSLSAGCEPRLITAIRQIRNIISTE